MRSRDIENAKQKIIRNQRTILNKIDKESRNMTSLEQEQYDRLEDQWDRLESRQRRAEESEFGGSHSGGSVYRSMTISDRSTWSTEEREWDEYLRLERRDLALDQDPKGGFVVPEFFQDEVIEEIKSLTFMRNISRVIELDYGDVLHVPKLSARPADPSWTSELSIGAADTSMQFSKRQFYGHPLAEYELVSNDLRNVSRLDIGAYVTEQLGFKFSVKEERGFLNGTGANEPVGVMVATDLGISSSRDVSTGNTSTSIKSDGLIEALYSLEAGYRTNARWLFHRDAVKAIRKLKTGDGQYIWTPGFATDRPDTILGKPYHESEFMPNAFTTGQYVGIIGDFRRGYWIVQTSRFSIQVLLERFADSNQTAYVGRERLDGAPVVEQAFARVTLS